MKDGFLRIATATPKIRVADSTHNTVEIERLICEAAEAGCAVISFPELCVTAYTCGDLFLSKPLVASAEAALKTLMQNTMDRDILCSVGLPVAYNGKLYNCAAVFLRGELLGLSAKTNIPSHAGFDERRCFTPAMRLAEIEYCGQSTVIGSGLLYTCDSVEDLKIGVEICEDLWVSEPPSARLAENGATVLLNAACSNETAGKAEYRRTYIKAHSGRISGAYVYSNAGEGESTTDMVFAGHNLIAENGDILAESKLLTTGLTIAEIDLERLIHERMLSSTREATCDEDVLPISFSFKEETIKAFMPKRKYSKLPFVPNGGKASREDSETILDLQSAGLAARLRHINSRQALLGLSGGLDSALALIVTGRAFDMMGLDKAGIIAVSMPCFGTSERGRSNAVALAGGIGAEYMEIPIERAVLQHFEDIGQDVSNFDVTFENAQARERTQVLMDLSNRLGGLVVGTGDLSELALGWATYNGDHMSMYAVNSCVPKTLVRYLVKHTAEKSEGKLKEALLDILDTPVSPELLPPKDGEISQRTEDIVGPYELHDFFLYHMLSFGFSPGKIFRMAERTFEGDYDSTAIKKWLKVFYSRFFTQQFKRTCMPDGVMVCSVSLSPRGGYNIPSDASAAIWLAEIDKL